MNISNKSIFVMFAVLLLLLILFLCNMSNANNPNMMIGFQIFYVILSIVFIYFLYQTFYTKELFDTPIIDKPIIEVIISNEAKNDPRIVDLDNFFAFLDYFQTTDMNENSKNLDVKCMIDGEFIKIGNEIRNLMRMLHFIVNVNNKDNFYNRFIVMKFGSDMDYDSIHTHIHQNYDELVRNKISKQFTFLPPNEYDLYYPKPSINSDNQNPLPLSINVHNYYTDENTQVNLVALQRILEMAQDNDHKLFGDVVRSTEHVAFEDEFMVPLLSIKNSMYNIVTSRLYKKYLDKQQFQYKYQKYFDK